MAIARLDSVGSARDVTSTTYTVSAGSDRLLVACFFYHSGGAIRLVTSATYGTQSMTKAHNQTVAGASGAEVWYLLEAGIAAASNTTLARTYDTEPTVDGIVIASYTGVNQTGGSTTNPTNVDASATGSTPNPLILDLTEANGGLVVSAVSSVNTTGTSWNATMTEQYDDDDAGNSAFTMADRLSTTSANVDIEPTRSGSVGRAVGVACSFATGSSNTTIVVPTGPWR